MPSDPADQSLPAGRPRWWAAGLLLLVSLVVAGGMVLLLRHPQEAVLPGAGPPRDAGTTSGDAAADTRADAAARLLDRLTVRLETGTRRQVAALAAPGNARAERELGTLRDNVRALRVTALSMRYVAERSGQLSADQEQALGNQAWVGDVQLIWRLRGVDRAKSRMRIPVTFREVAGSARFVTAHPDYGGAVPLWMLDRVSVERTARSVVVTTDPMETDRFSRLADQAVVDVRKVLGRWRGRVVVEVPRDQRELTRLLGSAPSAYAAIAAVTTTVDGSFVPGAPVHIFVNPRVFDPLGPRGSRIVLSHEATHVAVDAAVSSVPPWLLEGFADYVALAHVDLPVSRAASQILAQVRRRGTPAHLPGPPAFDPEYRGLGASYESAWLACRLIAERYGERHLIAFYRASDRAASTTGPFRRVLGTDQQQFTRDWRGDLRRLAG